MVLLLAAGAALAIGALGARAAAGLEQAAAPALGVLQTFYSTPDFEEPPLSRGLVARPSLAFLLENRALPRRNFSVRWEGYWDQRHDGPIDLYTRADDRLSVRVDGERVALRDLSDGLRTVAHRLHLEPGVRHLRVDYVQLGGVARLTLRWAPAGEAPRIFAPGTLFPEPPGAELLGLVRRAETLRRVEAAAWRAFRILLAGFLGVTAAYTWIRLGLALLVRRAWAGRRWLAREYAWAGRFALVAAGAGVTVTTLAVRSAGLNPRTLWYDDLVWGAIARAGSLVEVITLPAHAPPGFFVALRFSRALFGDPEWSLQLVPFAAGIAAIPAVAFLALRATGSPGLAVLGAALAALNPLLAHHTIFVKQYSLDFLLTALLLLAAQRLFTASAVTAASFGRFAAFGATSLFFSVTSPLVSASLVNLVALREWLTRRREAAAPLFVAAGYNVFLVAAFLLLRGRSNERLQRDFSRDFMPESWDGAWQFLATRGVAMVQAGLPGPYRTPPWQPELLSTLLPFVAIGVIWLFVRPATRWLGWGVLGCGVSALAANYLRVYPIGAVRTSAYFFPIVIVLCVAGVHAATAWMPARELLRGVVGLAAAAYALLFPVYVEYYAVDDERLVRRVAEAAAPADGLVLSPPGTYLAAHYGPWRVSVTWTPSLGNATDARIARDGTLHLPHEESPTPYIDAFLRTSSPGRIWYLNFRDGDAEEVAAALERHGYIVRLVDRSVRGLLYLGEMPDTPAR